MRYRGHEIVFDPIQFLELFVSHLEFATRCLEFARFAFQLTAIGANLRSLVEYIQHLVQAQCFLRGDGGHHDPCGGAADRARQQGLGKMHRTGIGGQLFDVRRPTVGRVAFKCLARTLTAKKTLSQRNQFLYLRLATPQGHTARRLAF